MSRKLTLRMSEDAIERAKRYARRRGTSVSKLVEQFFDRLEDESAPPPSREIGDTPLVASLRGILKDAEVDKDDYYEYLWEKHQ